MEKERFTMLLLDPGEIFFEDYSVQMIMLNSDKDKNQWLDGRLKLCSKSLVFVSKDINQALIKIQLKDTVIVEKRSLNNNLSRLNDTLLVKCKQYVEMLEGNILAPYKFIHEPANFQFSFNYAKIDDCLPQILQLLRAATLSTAEQNAMIMAIVHSRQSRFSFDTSWLEDLYEQVVFEIQANKVLPLVINPGKILITMHRIYFQPYNNMDQYPVLKINLKDIKNVIKRRFLLRQVGLEIKWIQQSNDTIEQHLFLATKNEEERDTLYTNLIAQEALKIETIYQNHMTMQWQNGLLSNYDYLLYINSLADRTFHDLTQYIVMPWVLQDYTSQTLDLNDSNVYRDLSKPIGALEPKRLERLKARFAEMSEPKFLYGSHYSAPGFVLFYLVRKYPQYMLCLQNGRFDHPDRMFNRKDFLEFINLKKNTLILMVQHIFYFCPEMKKIDSVADVWKNVLVNMSDFKELIPEFYDINSHGDFLVNSYGIDFGFRHDGTKISNVQLPPWAEDPSDFVQKLRNALESDFVSKNLHHWIDLIFGFKQKGEESLKADNVFFHLCYEGAVDLDTIKDINDRHGLEVQIMEFGQIPKQIFKLPHPKRLMAFDFVHNEARFLQQKSTIFESTPIDISLKNSIVIQIHKEAVSAVTVIDDEIQGENIVSLGRDGVMKIYNLKSGELLRSVSLASVPLCSCISYRTYLNSNVLVIGSWDNSLIFYNIEYGKVFDILHGHEDAVSCLAYSKTRNIIVSSSWDCTTKIWNCPNPEKKMKPSENFVAELDHDSQVTCINISKDETLLTTGTEDGDIFLWELNNSYSLQFTVKEHTAKINSIIFGPDSKNIVSCANNKFLSFIDVQTSTQTFITRLDEEPLTLAWINSQLLIGDIKGDLVLWDPQTVKIISKFHCHQGALASLAVTEDNKKVITGGQDKKVIVWNCM